MNLVDITKKTTTKNLLNLIFQFDVEQFLYLIRSNALLDESDHISHYIFHHDYKVKNQHGNSDLITE